MDNRWWERRVFYQIYPRSFADSNADGIGDIKGIISKLDYLKWLGIGAIWLCPVYDSPNEDMGYDIRDYESIMKEFGTMEDFKILLSELHRRDIKLVMDLVVNHTSDEHKWFVEAKKDSDSKYRDYYIWRKGQDGKEPNNWSSFFTPSAWTYDEKSDEWYLHLFAEKQPDLNWENANMRNEIYEMINHWFDLGVDGFRMDVISLIAKAPGLPNVEGKNYAMAPEYFAFQPKLHEYLREMRRKCFDGRNCMCVGETTFVSTENANTVVGDGRELDMLFQFDLMDIDGSDTKWSLKPFDINKFKEVIDKWQKAINWNTLFWSNHDQPRVVSRFGSVESDEYWKTSAKMLAVAMYLLKGTPFIYQGEEIGMTNYPFKDETQLRDIESINLLKQNSTNKDWAWNSILAKGRDNARTPMQWDDSINAGFSEGKPWIDVNPNYLKINVSSQIDDKDSILNFYRELIDFRTSNDTILKGDYKQILFDDKRLFAYERYLGDEKITVYCNFTNEPIVLDTTSDGDVIINVNTEINDSIYTLGKYGALVIRRFE